jgi:rSAM/selenodomain-associated transferase 1
MGRWPAPSRCKSRLAAGIGSRPAAAIQARLASHTAAVLAGVRRRPGIEVALALAGAGPRAARRWGDQLGLRPVLDQGRGGLGLRLRRQVQRGLRAGCDGVLLIGTDLPALAESDLLRAAGALADHAMVLAPAADGGYWLIGLREDAAWPFSGIAWGSNRVLEQTLTAARGRGRSVALLPCRNDLDHPADLAPWLG